MPVDAPITSRRHPLVARLRAAARREGDEVLLDGPHLLAEALRSPAAGGGRCTLHAVVATHGAVARAEIAALCDDAAARGLPVHLVPQALATAISPASTPTGVVALASVRMARLDETIRPAPALVVVLAGIQDPGNVGGIVRTAEAAGATGIVLLPGTADPLGWKAVRASMGSALRLPLHRAATAGEVIEALARHGVALVAADAAPRAPSRAVDWTAPLALAIGAEGAGVPQDVLDAAEARVRIDLAPAVESLNAATAAAVLLFEARRVRGGRESVIDGDGAPARPS